MGNCTSSAQQESILFPVLLRQTDRQIPGSCMFYKEIWKTSSAFKMPADITSLYKLCTRWCRRKRVQAQMSTSLSRIKGWCNKDRSITDKWNMVKKIKKKRSTELHRIIKNYKEGDINDYSILINASIKKNKAEVFKIHSLSIQLL